MPSGPHELQPHHPRQSTSGIANIVSAAYTRHLANRNGALADYIPELAAVEPDRFGVALATVDGTLITAGDTDHPFTIQSISKAFVYCLALELAGRDAVIEQVGVEPSGDALNAIVFDPHTNRPFNPMVNAGAITVAGIVRDARARTARCTSQRNYPTPR